MAKKKYLKNNTEKPDYVYFFENKYSDGPVRHCIAQEYQSSLDFKYPQGGKIVAMVDNEKVGELINDGNGVEVMGTYYNYVEYQILKMLLLADEEMDPCFKGTVELEIKDF